VVVFFGIGGSYLGSKVLFDVHAGAYWNQRTNKERKGFPQVYFSGNNVDACEYEELLAEMKRQASNKKFAHQGKTSIMLKAGLIETGGIIIDAKSGTTGAGRTLKAGSMYCAVNENFHAYGVGTHRHTPEIEQIYSEFAKAPVVIQFTPHLLPVDRGILATCYADIKPGVTSEQIDRAYRDMYEDEFFVRVRGQGICPEIKNVRASNYVDLGWQIDKRTNRLIAMTVLDNLVKGAAGQAVQNMNVMFGLKENTGLTQLPIYP
jgi:Acetylglutamate semialdehyde dehydrogenase